MNDAGFEFGQPAPGLFVVRYEREEHLAPGRQGELVAAAVEAARHAPVALVFVVGPGVRIVPAEVPTFWLKTVGELPVAALAVVSDSFAVRIATNAFGAANGLVGRTLAVSAFPDERRAFEWIREHAPGRGPPS